MLLQVYNSLLLAILGLMWLGVLVTFKCIRGFQHPKIWDVRIIIELIFRNALKSVVCKVRFKLRNKCNHKKVLSGHFKAVDWCFGLLFGVLW